MLSTSRGYVTRQLGLSLTPFLGAFSTFGGSANPFGIPAEDDSLSPEEAAFIRACVQVRSWTT
jgi:hypothetical protein